MSSYPGKEMDMWKSIMFKPRSTLCRWMLWLPIIVHGDVPLAVRQRGTQLVDSFPCYSALHIEDELSNHPQFNCQLLFSELLELRHLSVNTVMLVCAPICPLISLQLLSGKAGSLFLPQNSHLPNRLMEVSVVCNYFQQGSNYVWIDPASLLVFSWQLIFTHFLFLRWCSAAQSRALRCQPLLQVPNSWALVISRSVPKDMQETLLISKGSCRWQLGGATYSKTLTLGWDKMLWRCNSISAEVWSSTRSRPAPQALLSRSSWRH